MDPAKFPVGFPLPKRTNALLDGTKVPSGKTCLNSEASEIVKPEISTVCEPIL